MWFDGLIESIFNRKVQAIAKGHSGNCTAKKPETTAARRIHSERNIFRQRRRDVSLKDFSMVFCFLLCEETVMRISRISYKDPELTANSLE